MKHKVKVRWWYWAQYALWTGYDVMMGAFYMLMCMLGFGLAFALVYYMEITLK